MDGASNGFSRGSTLATSTCDPKSGNFPHPRPLTHPPTHLGESFLLSWLWPRITASFRPKIGYCYIYLQKKTQKPRKSSKKKKTHYARTKSALFLTKKNRKCGQNTKAIKQNDDTETRNMWKKAVKRLRTCFRKYQNLQSHTCEFFDRAPRAGTNNENGENRSSQRSKIAKARMRILRSRTQSWY